MKEKDNLPEEKLLRLIRKRRRPLRSEGKDSGAQTNREASTTLRDGGIFKTVRRGQGDYLLLTNKILIILSSLSLVYLVGYKYQYIDHMKMPVSDAIEEAGWQVDRERHNENADLKSFDHYKQAFQIKNLFQTVEVSEPAVKERRVNADPQLTKDFKVVGIILDQSPQVVIQDLQTQQTYFLKEGDYLKEAVVEEIMESKVILSVDGELIEIAP